MVTVSRATKTTAQALDQQRADADRDREANGGITLPIVAGPVSDGWNDAATEANARSIRGTLLKFADWNWSRGKETVPVEKGTQLVAVGTAAAWVKWANNKPAETRMRQPGTPMPDRDELGDLDESTWEKGPSGDPKDPWQSTRFVYLVDAMTAEAFTFSTSSYGGRECVSNLGDQIARFRTAHPDAVPIVALDAAPMPTKFGRKSKPILRVVGWKATDGATAEVKQLTLAQELGDEVPH